MTSDKQGFRISLKNSVSFIAHLQLGVRLIDAGRYLEASEVLEKAVRLDPSSSEAWRKLGVAYGKEGKLDDATAALEKSLNLDPDHSETWSNLGGVRRRKSRRGGQIVADWSELRKSIEAYEKAVDCGPTDSYARFNADLLNLMLVLHERRDDSAAIERFRKLKLLCQWETLEDPSDGWKSLNLSGTLAILADKDEAVAEVHRFGILRMRWRRNRIPTRPLRRYAIYFRLVVSNLNKRTRSRPLLLL
jgi:tetratricopeptide (TPR) repeat protein